MIIWLTGRSCKHSFKSVAFSQSIKVYYQFWNRMLRSVNHICITWHVYAICVWGECETHDRSIRRRMIHKNGLKESENHCLLKLFVLVTHLLMMMMMAMMARRFVHCIRHVYVQFSCIACANTNEDDTLTWANSPLTYRRIYINYGVTDDNGLELGSIYVGFARAAWYFCFLLAFVFISSALYYYYFFTEELFRKWLFRKQNFFCYTTWGQDWN